MSLIQVQVKSTKHGNKPIKLFDGRGLYLEVVPGGGRWWRFKYRFEGKGKRLSLGVFPDVSLKDARERCDDARKALSKGIDPSANRKAAKAARAEQSANSFEVITSGWYAKHADNWAASHSQRVIRLFERDIFPWLGSRPIVDITAPELLTVMRRIEERNALETAHRALGNCGQVFRYAIATGRAPRDPAADLRGALAPVKGAHFAAITEPKRAGELLRLLEGYQGTMTVRCALRLAPLVFVRPGELRTARWADINLDTAEWRYTVKALNRSRGNP